jgi:hypothetical protein
MRYEIPNNAVHHLGLGAWVEIIEAYDLREETDAIRVTAMRVGSETIAFSDKARHLSKPLRPHEGQVIAIEKQSDRTLFRIHLS